MVLNGDILEYEGVGLPTVGEGINDQATGGIDVEALILMMNFVQHVWNQHTAVLRLNGGFDWRNASSRVVSGVVRVIGPDGIDWVARHLFTDRYRAAVQARRNAQVRGGMETYQRASYQNTVTPRKKKRIRDYIALETKKSRQRSPQKQKMNLVYNARERANTEPPGEFPWRDIRNPNVQTHTANPINTQLNMVRTVGNNGMTMLNWKNRLTKKYHTECFYEMSMIMCTKRETGVDYHFTDMGQGPLLYCIYYDVMLDGTKRETGFNFPMEMDQGAVGDSYKGVGWNKICYVFAADWPFLVMNHDPKTQDTANKNTGLYLSYDYRDVLTTTDNSGPIEMTNVTGNDDWTYITHYYTVHTFDMTNTSKMPHVVEILFFTFKADADAMDYRKQVLSVTRRQDFFFQEYIQGSASKPSDINIVKRKRIYLAGFSNKSVLYSGQSKVDATTPNQMRENSITYKHVVKRKYVMKRPINTTYNHNISETDFFNTYYDAQKGIYCRVQAWTLEGNLIHDENDGGYCKMIGNETTVNNLSQTTCTKLGYGVNVYMSKKSYFKLDEPIYKSYATA